MRLRKWTVRALLCGALLIAAATLATYAALRASLPPGPGVVDAHGLAHRVEIRFDAWRRPFVTADTLDDALYAQGWLHASDRLWQMEMLRRAATGRLSELLGASTIGSDKELWRMGVPQMGKQIEGNASPALRASVEAYVRGVNAALAAYTLPPPEFLLLQHAPAPWQPSDVYAMGALMAFQSAGNADSELLRMALVQALGADRAAIFLPDDGAQPDFPFVMSRADRRGADGVMAALEAFDAVDPLDQPLMPRFAFGSNGWAVAPGRSKTGHALFAFDSHDDLGVPNLFYEVHLFFEGTKQIRGWSVAGLPGVINGFNERIAWGFTNIGDSQDLFIETRAKDDPLEFRDGGSWYRARTETVEIPVKGRAAPETLTIVYTKNGPLISDDPPIALAWTAHDLQGAGIDAILAFNRAQNWDEFVAALDGLAAPTLNATYADIDGTIGFRTVGLIPVRGNGDGLVPLDGGDPANRWQGTVPQDAMPRLHNPAAGFVAAANARVNAAGEGPLVSSDNDPGYRIRRIRLVLSSRTDLTVDDMRALQTDWYDQQAELVMPAMMAALRADNLSGPARAAYDALDAWRGNWIAHPDGAAPIVFQAWYRALIGEVFAPGMPPDLFARLFKSNYIVNHAIDRLVLREVDSAWWRGERDAIMQRAFATAVLEVQAAQGGDVSSWRLDRMHRVRVDHELGKAVPMLAWFFSARPAPWGGSTNTVGRSRYRYDRAYDATAGATVRVAGEMAPSGMNMAAIIPGGQSGHPLDPHYLDQFPRWLAGALEPIATTPGAVSGTTLHLQPKAPK